MILEKMGVNAIDLAKNICELRDECEEFSYRICRVGAALKNIVTVKSKVPISCEGHLKVVIAWRREVAQAS